MTGTAPLAEEAAATAARAAGVRIRELSGLADLVDVVELYRSVWGGDEPQLSVELLRAFAKSGNYVAGAYAGDRLVGACVGFFAAPGEDALYSHIAGVSAAARGRSVGSALKLHQRAWTLARGVADILWTFDPLVARNAYVNLVKLGAEPVEYLPNFYGGMSDAVNAGIDSDRLLVRWRLESPAAVAACAGHPAPADAAAARAAGAGVALGVGADGSPAPVPDQPDPRRAGTVLVAVPADIVALRTSDPPAARAWRFALREVLWPLLAGGARVTGFDRAGWYVVVTAEERAS